MKKVLEINIFFATGNMLDTSDYQLLVISKNNNNKV